MIISNSEPAASLARTTQQPGQARLDSSSGQLVNSPGLPDGTWSMQISASQFGSKDTRDIVFEMDGQIFSDERGMMRYSNYHLQKIQMEEVFC